MNIENFYDGKHTEEIMIDEVEDDKNVYQIIVDCGKMPQCDVENSLMTKVIPVNGISTNKMWIDRVIFDISDDIGVNDSLIPTNVTKLRHNGLIYENIFISLTEDCIEIVSTDVEANGFTVKVCIRYTKRVDTLIDFNNRQLPYVDIVASNKDNEILTNMDDSLGRPIYKMTIDLGPMPESADSDVVVSSKKIDLTEVTSAWLTNSYFFTNNKFGTILDDITHSLSNAQSRKPEVLIRAIFEDSVVIELLNEYDGKYFDDVNYCFTTMYYTKNIEFNVGVTPDPIRTPFKFGSLMIEDFSNVRDMDPMKIIDDIDDVLDTVSKKIVIDADGFLDIHTSLGIFSKYKLPENSYASILITTGDTVLYRDNVYFDNIEFDLENPTSILLSHKNKYMVGTGDIITLLVKFNNFTGSDVTIGFNNDIIYKFINIVKKNPVESNYYELPPFEEIDIGTNSSGQTIYCKLIKYDHLKIEEVENSNDLEIENLSDKYVIDFGGIFSLFTEGGINPCYRRQLPAYDYNEYLSRYDDPVNLYSDNGNLILHGDNISNKSFTSEVWIKYIKKQI